LDPCSLVLSLVCNVVVVVGMYCCCWFISLEIGHTTLPICPFHLHNLFNVVVGYLFYLKILSILCVLYLVF
jgi:hypothetical protein